MPSSVAARLAPSEPQAGPIVKLQAGAVRVRHQPPEAFHLSYSGDRPVMLFLFNAPRPTHGEGRGPKRAGSFALLRPGRPVEIHHPDPLEVLAVVYDDPALWPHEPEDAPEPDCGRVDPGVRTLAHELRRVVLREPAPDTGYVEALARSLLLRALQVEQPEPRSRSAGGISPFRLRRVLEHIDLRLSERITVPDLAAVAGMSRGHFTRVFEGAVGETPHRFVLTRRLEAARRMVEEGAADLATVAARTGFSSHAHLTTTFRQAFGVTPAEHRRREVLRRLPAS